MKWKKFTLDTTTAAVDLISAEFQDIGIEGIEVEDHVPLSGKDTKGMFIDILPELPPDDGTARVSFYLSPVDNVEEKLAKVRACLNELRRFTDIGRGTITESETEDKDWINNWKTFFHPFTVDDILIKPTWEKVPDGDAGMTVIEMDPGTAFGTGSHETTQLCIRQIRKYIGLMQKAGVRDGIEVLDVGTGSGILGIAALKLGASHVFATDLDENALSAAAENLDTNHIPRERFDMVCGNLISDRKVQDAAGYEKYDIAAANILAPVIIALQGEIARHLKHGGIFITSGIIREKAEDVRKAFDANPAFAFLEENTQGEWVNITVRRV